MRVYTGESIRKIEQACFETGISELRLMENAGVACAKAIRKEFDLENRRGCPVAILCGKGKNGGDGFVIARKLAEIGAQPVIILTHGYPHIAEPVEMLGRAQELEIQVEDFAASERLCLQYIEDAALIVDCIFGIGYHGAADEKTRAIFKAVNRSPAKVASVDVPSGLDSEGEDFEPAHIRADFTVSISAYKPVHINELTAPLCGKQEVVSINIDERFFAAEPAVACISDTEEVRAMLPHRAADANKGSFGHVLLVCGSYTLAAACKDEVKACRDEHGGSRAQRCRQGERGISRTRICGDYFKNQ